MTDHITTAGTRQVPVHVQILEARIGQEPDVYIALNEEHAILEHDDATAIARLILFGDGPDDPTTPNPPQEDA